MHKIGYEDHYAMNDLSLSELLYSSGYLNCARPMGSLATQVMSCGADDDASISAEWAVVEREPETHANRYRRRCSDHSAVCKLVGQWFGFTD